jgi:hypothetical protein
MTPREEHVKSMFFPKLLKEEDAIEMVKRISSIGDRFGFVGNQGNDDRRKHKYDVWIANEVKRQIVADPNTKTTILDKEHEVFLILDWAIETRPNLTSFSFDQALEEQKKWMVRLQHQGVIRPPPIDVERVIYKCSNKYFLYLLKPEDLAFEAQAMGHCVGGDHYKSKIKNSRSLIISLRDERNMPHVTIEIGLTQNHVGKWQGSVLQQQGKANLDPNEKYHAALREFALFSNGALTKKDADFLTGKT